MPVSPSAERRARITLRCLTEDLQKKIPSPDVDLGELDHPLLNEARRIAPTSPRGQKRILVIAHPLVYRIRYRDQRGATWLDHQNMIVWLLAVQKREQDSEDDAYQYFAKLHAAGKLLPSDDDYLRDRVERAARLIRALRLDLAQVLTNARRAPDHVQSASLADHLPIRLLVRQEGDLEEIWFAVSVRDDQGGGVRSEIRDYVFAILEYLVKPTEWEWRDDWPTSPLQWYEVARLGVREMMLTERDH